MPHINVNTNYPGIRSLMIFRPETAESMNELANALLRTDEGISMAEREIIATYVSYLNDCFYCQTAHGAIASEYLGDATVIQQVKLDYRQAPITEKLKTLLTIASSVQKGGKHVTPEQVQAARDEGATDREIHDTVLIAAAFCMFNRYVDGLAAEYPKDASTYPPRARQVVANGYGNHLLKAAQSQ